MFLENTFETANLSVKMSYINYKQDKTYKVLKPAVKDEELTNLIGLVATKKDKIAFSNLFKLVGPRIKGYLMKLGSNDIVAEDLLQEVMLTVWRKSETFDRSKAAVSTWLFTIARNKRIEQQFSAWDGSHNNLERVIKKAMNDPDSYEHDETVYWDMGDHLVVKTTYRGKNAFGGVVRNFVKAKVSLDGDILQILDQT